MSNENGISPYTNIIEEYTQAESPSQPYKPALKKLWKMDVSTDEGTLLLLLDYTRLCFRIPKKTWTIL